MELNKDENEELLELENILKSDEIIEVEISSILMFKVWWAFAATANETLKGDEGWQSFIKNKIGMEIIDLWNQLADVHYSSLEGEEKEKKLVTPPKKESH